MKNIAIFASGNGTNFESLVCACEQGQIQGKVLLMVCDNPQAYVIQRAENHKVDLMVFNPKEYGSKKEYEKEIIKKLEEYKIDWICLAGYMRLIGSTMLEKYEGKIINIHPALLPAFKGAHGIRDAYEYGVKVFGVTIHYVDSGMDSGKIIAQRALNYIEGETLEQVEQRIHQIEHELYPEVLKKLCEGE